MKACEECGAETMFVFEGKRYCERCFGKLIDELIAEQFTPEERAAAFNIDCEVIKND